MMKRHTAAMQAGRHGGERNGQFKNRRPLLHEGISVANRGDLPAIMRLIGRGAGEGRLVPRSRAEVAADVEVGSAFVYRTAGAITGITFLSIYSMKLAEIRSFYVHEDHRGNGTGKALITSALAAAKGLGIAEVLAITKKDNEGGFAKFGFGRRSGFQTALFRKRQESRHDGMQSAEVDAPSIHDLDALCRLMNDAAAAGELVPRARAELFADIMARNAYVYRKGGTGEISGMGFLSVYSRRLAEIRSLVGKTPGARSLLLERLAGKADLLRVNETMIILKNAHRDAQALAEQGFRQELHDFRVALFAQTGR
jgi:N-acetylglutamate synthase-like GNAT family acetyltransferase